MIWGQTVIYFGDGEQGARLPTSRETLTATYRSGGGEAGNLPPNSLTSLQSHLAHLKSVTNPALAQGGLPEESAGHGRQQAPHRLRALGRIVTLKDYVDFTATFPGISQSAVHPVPEHAPRWIDIAVVPTQLSTARFLHKLLPCSPGWTKPSANRAAQRWCHSHCAYFNRFSLPWGYACFPLRKCAQVKIGSTRSFTPCAKKYWRLTVSIC